MQFLGGLILAIQWRESYAIGITEIDDQHKKLFEAIDKLFTACGQGKGKEQVGSTLKFLEEYTIVHFTDEQKLHIKHNYPERIGHRKIHDDFLRTFEGLKKQFDEEGASVLFISTVNKTVLDWLIKHIGTMDKAFAAYVKGQQSEQK
jgi:hemerythrin